MEKYHKIQKLYERCLEKYGDNHNGVGWLDYSDLESRFDVMLDIINSRDETKILDFGCGNGLLYSHINSLKLDKIEYSGLDISNKFVELCRNKFPTAEFHCMDINKEQLSLEYDYAICNGTFTVKSDLTFNEMFDFFSETTTTLFEKSNKGIAFNVWSTHCKNRYDHMFHVPLDTMVKFVTNNLSNHFIIRNDYGLEDYTVYVYRDKFQRKKKNV